MCMDSPLTNRHGRDGDTARDSAVTDEAESVHAPDSAVAGAGAPQVDASEAGTPETEVDDDGVLYDEQVRPEYGILGFTLRELLIVAAWLLAFVTSFFPLVGWAGPSVWGMGIQWILPIGVPTAAAFLLVLRRFSPDGIRRVGSLGIDQFASVAFSVSAVYWAQLLWELVAGAVRGGGMPPVWVPVVQFAAMLALVALSVFARLIPGLREDFHGRLVTLAHRNANPVRPVIARPRPQRPARASETPLPRPDGEGPTADDAPDAGTGRSDDATSVLDVELSEESTTDQIERLGFSGHVPVTSHASGGGTGSTPTVDDPTYVPSYARGARRGTPARQDEPAPGADPRAAFDPEATNPRAGAPIAQPFWALAPTERDVLDERGRPLFRIGPEAWALVIEDRGGAYVVRHDDGRVGYLHDIADMTKG